jgi:hypothetical protein
LIAAVADVGFYWSESVYAASLNGNAKLNADYKLRPDNGRPPGICDRPSYSNMDSDPGRQRARTVIQIGQACRYLADGAYPATPLYRGWKSQVIPTRPKHWLDFNHFMAYSLKNHDY